jgi:hypothetical protein
MDGPTSTTIRDATTHTQKDICSASEVASTRRWTYGYAAYSGGPLDVD